MCADSGFETQCPSFIACGGLRADFIITAQGQVRTMEMGGNALYAAAGAKLWLDPSSFDSAQDGAGQAVAILARIGDDYPLGWLNDLREAGFNVEGIQHVPGKQDQRTFYAYLDNDVRVDTNPQQYFAQLGLPLPEELNDYVHSTLGQDDPDRYEPLAVTPEDLELLFAKWNHRRPTTDDRRLSSSVDRPSSVVAMHMAPISIRTQRHLPEAARRLGVRLVSADPGERAMQPKLMPHIEEMLAQIDVFIPSDQEVESLFRDESDEMDAKQCAEWFAVRGPGLVVLKLGADGVLVHERNSQQFWHVPALPVNVIDVTGAGDAFCGGFMADLIGHGDSVRAAITGTVSASFAIQDYGALHMLSASHDEADHRAAFLRGLVSAV